MNPRDKKLDQAAHAINRAYINQSSTDKIIIDPEIPA